MNKAIKYAIRGALAGGIGNGILNIINQAEQSERPFDWAALFKAIGKGALVIGGASGLVGLGMDYLNTQENPLNTDLILSDMLAQLRLSKEDKGYRLLKGKSNWLILLLQEEYKTMLKNVPFCFGSTERGTALKEDFDIDICLPFKAGSFSSTEEMFHDVLEVLESKIGSNGIVKVRPQKKSIGVFFNINGADQKVDILPHKISKVRGNKSSGYLYVNTNGIFGRPSRTKTDIDKQNSLSLTDMQKKLLTALKVWKQKREVPISSHLLQYLIVECYRFNRGHIPRGFTQKLIMAFTFIQESIATISIRSVENTNNILTNLPIGDKELIVSACKAVIEEYNYQPNSIIQILS